MTEMIKTVWADDVNTECPHPEYPRPQLVRDDWLNLNGRWEYAITPRTARSMKRVDGEILVPFCIESQLSGVGRSVQPDERLWYRRTFTVPPSWADTRILLNFGAVDWHTTVFVNGKKVGEHKGGYDAFSFDVTDFLSGASTDSHEIVVSVWDPSDTRDQPRGKQTLTPKGCFYTTVTGIWQTVWLEPVDSVSIARLAIVPDIHAGEVSVDSTVVGNVPKGTEIVVTCGKLKSRGKPNRPMTLSIPKAKLWSPDNPYLYDLTVKLMVGKTVLDTVKTYVGMRKTEVKADSKGVKRLFLNNEPLFQFGPLDQGWWPDGLYTAPTDDALKFDVQWTKDAGFNMIRKHVKIEPARWYHHCDTIGILVWQDMVSGRADRGPWECDVDKSVPETTFAKPVARQFRTELKRMMDGLGNHPSIVSWVLFNERWGQHLTVETVAWMKSRDHTRPVNSASGGNFYQVGDVLDVHSYPEPTFPRLDPEQAVVCGEFGGLGWPIPKHLWNPEMNNWGYCTYHSQDELKTNYARLIDMLPAMVEQGLAAAVYTQTTDVEGEVNGFLTYDRKVEKMELEWLDVLHKNARIEIDPGI